MKKVFFLLLGWFGLTLLAACDFSQEEPKTETPPRPVRIETIAKRDLPIIVQSVGRLAPDREVILSAEVPGLLMQYKADVGSKVRKGTMIAQLDPVDYTLALKETEANLRAARSNLPVAENSYERAKDLLPEKVITPELFDRAEASYKSAKASVARLQTMVEMAQRRLEKTTITTPFGGHVTKRYIETGQHIVPGNPIMKIADMATMRVRIYINELDYVHVDKEDPVTVTVEAFSKLPIIGRVDEIGIQADPRTNTFEVEIIVNNPDFKLKAGLTARVALQTKVIPDVIMIAQNCVLFREDRKEVFVVGENHLAEVRIVTLGRMDGSHVQILKGLDEGDQLVVAGAQYLKSGNKVRVTP